MPEVGTDFVISEAVLEQARGLGFKGDVRKELLRVVQQSAPFSKHPRANRRYEGLMLRVENNSLTLIEPIDYDPVKELQRQRWQARIDRKEQSQLAQREGKKFVDLTRKP